MYSTGCGLCLGDPDVAEFTLVAIHRDGKVLHVDYAVGTGRGVEFAPSAPLALRATASHVFGLAGPAYAEHDPGVRLHSMQAATLADEDWERVDDVLGRALQRAAPPTRATSGCDDCGGFVLQAWDPPAATYVDVNAAEDQPDRALLRAAEQMALLGQWAADPEAHI